MSWRITSNVFFLIILSFTICHPVGGKDDAVVKGPPSPPRHLSWRVVGVAETEYHFSWVASLNTGGLPVNYSVQLCATKICDHNLCKWSMKPECRPRNIRSNHQKFSCVVNDDPNCTRRAYDYTLLVLAENELGNASSTMFLPVVPYNLVTPRPPLGVKAEARGSKEIYIHWKPRTDWLYLTLEYKIVFHSKDGINKTKSVPGPQNYTRLTSKDGLEAFVTYYIYVMVRFISNKTARSHFSEVHQPVVVKTKAGVPSPLPVVKKHHTKVFPEDASLRNVTVEWELSSITAWRGTPHLYKIECRRHQLTVCSSEVNATLNHTVLHRLNSSDSYNVYIRMCNKQGRCSGLGNSYTISAEDPGMGTDSTRKMPNGGLIIIILAVVLFVALLVGSSFLLWRRKQYLRAAVSLRNLALDPPVPDEYSTVDPVIEHPYNRVDLNDADSS